MSSTKHEPKSDFDARASADMDRHLATPEWTTREKLALSCRMLAREEHGSALAGQITARGDEPGTIWTARFGLGLDEIRGSDFLLVDDDLDVLDGDGMPNPSNRFRLWIYRHRSAICVGAVDAPCRVRYTQSRLRLGPARTFGKRTW